MTEATVPEMNVSSKEIVLSCGSSPSRLICPEICVEWALTSTKAVRRVSSCGSVPDTREAARRRCFSPVR